MKLNLHNDHSKVSSKLQYVYLHNYNQMPWRNVIHNYVLFRSKLLPLK